MKKFEGRYVFQKDDKKRIEIIAENEGLILHQLWNGKKITFYSRSAVDFYNEDLIFPLQFVMENGQVKQLICFGKDKWDKLN